MTHAYITGATGAIGMALVGELLRNRIATTVFLRDGSKRNSQMADSFGDSLDSGLLQLEYVSLEQLADYMSFDNREAEYSDVHNPCECDENAAGNTAAETGKVVFYHLGWAGTFGAERNDRTLQQRNVGYTLDAVRLAKRLGCTHFIGVGSQAEYGRVEGELTPQTAAAPENEYGRCKLAAGIESARLCAELGMRHSWMRVLSVYGPFDGQNTMIMSVIRGLLSGQRVPLTKGGQIWNYLYSGDAARALYLLGESDIGKKDGNHTGARGDSAVYCLAGSSACELREYILKLCRTVGADEKLLGFGDIPYGDRQVMYLTADIASLTSDTGFVPETTFEEGIKRTVEWVRTH